MADYLRVEFLSDVPSPEGPGRHFEGVDVRNGYEIVRSGDFYYIRHPEKFGETCVEVHAARVKCAFFKPDSMAKARMARHNSRKDIEDAAQEGQ